VEVTREERQHGLRGIEHHERRHPGREGNWLVPELIGRYRAEHRQVRFRLSQGSAHDGLAELLAGETDLLLTSPRPDDPLAAWSALFSQPLRLAVPPGHRLAARRRVHLRELADERFIMATEETGLRALTDHLCQRAGFSPRVAFESQDVETLRGLVSADLGVALLPDRPGAPDTPPVVAIADPGAARTIGLAWHRTRYRSAAAAAFAAHVKAESRHVMAKSRPRLRRTEPSRR
jgi:DNA-binding transcriptional LysR family regulator